MKFRELFLKNKTTTIVGLLLFTFLLTFQVYASNGLTHEMTEEERAKMPAYLETVRSLQTATSPPTAPVRNISEFEIMEGVLIAYPLGIPVEVVAEMSEDVMVTTIVENSTRQNQAINLYSSNGVNMANTNFLIAPYDSYWTRDYGPWYISDDNGTVSIMNFTYDRPRPDDNNIPIEMASFLGINWYEMDMVATGGNYMTDATGISASTDLIWEENSSKTPAQIDQIFLDYLGITTYHVTADPLGDYIKHIDCWGKYLDVDKVLIGRVPPSDSRYADYEAIADYFASQVSGYGNNYQVFRVDSPDGEPYTNSLILNNKVLVPIAGNSNDSAALAVYAAAMPGYEIIGYEGSWYSTDALHCRTKGVPDRGMLYIKHMPILGEQAEQSGYQITADIIPFSGSPLVANASKVYYRVNGGAYTPLTMTNTTGNTYTATIPGQTAGSAIDYYIHSEDTSGRITEHPLIGAPDPHDFTVAGAPQVPVADFSGTPTTVTEGNTVQFTDLSTNNPTSWSWTFEGGSPSSSTTQNPLVTYNTAGTYTVTLIATNAAGNDTETKTAYITVQSSGSCLGEITNPGFETGSLSGWTVSGSASVSTDANTGSYSASLDATGTTVEQVITGLCANTSYTVSAWGKAKSNALIYLGVKNYGGSDQTTQYIDSRFFQQKSLTFTTGSTNTSVTIFVIRQTGSKDGGVVDDFEIVLN